MPARHSLTLATGLAAAIPVIVSTVRAAPHWVPAADRAIIVTRAWDVLTGHTPLVGQYSEAGGAIGQVVHSPGPMLYWLLALPARYGGPAATAVTMGIVNTVAIVATVALARRRGGLVLMFATAVGVALMCQSLAAETFHDMWNPSAGLFPFLLLIFLCWSLACGEHRLLPAAVLVASYVMQDHLMYVLPAVGLLAVGVGGLLAGRIAHRRRGGRAGTSVARWLHSAARSSLLRWGLAAVVVGAICWSAPAIDELEHHPGNLTLIAQTASRHESRMGAGVGWHAVVRAVGPRPWWLYVPASRWERKYDVLATPTPRANNITRAILAALAVVGLIGLVRRRPDVTAAALIGLMLCAALAVEAAETPTARLLEETLGYTLWWGSQLGLWVWLILAWSLWLGLAWLARKLSALARPRISALALNRPGIGALDRPRIRALLPAAPPPASGPVPSDAHARTRPPAFATIAASALASVLCMAGVAAVGRAVAATGQPDEHAQEYRPIAVIAARLDRVIAPRQTVELLQGGLDWATLPIKPAVRWFLVRHGDRVLATGSYRRLGTYYELYNRPYSWIVDVADGSRPPERGLTLAIAVHFRDAWGPETLSVWVRPVRRPSDSPRRSPRPPPHARRTRSPRPSSPSR